jgi:hypothetical protein
MGLSYTMVPTLNCAILTVPKLSYYYYSCMPKLTQGNVICQEASWMCG